jgi:hypothetical protein
MPAATLVNAVCNARSKKTPLMYEADAADLTKVRPEAAELKSF